MSRRFILNIRPHGKAFLLLGLALFLAAACSGGPQDESDVGRVASGLNGFNVVTRAVAYLRDHPGAYETLVAYALVPFLTPES